MFKLRQTWNSVFPLKNLYVLDTKVSKIDPAWPITAQPPIHVNPKFFNVVSTEKFLEKCESRSFFIHKHF